MCDGMEVSGGKGGGPGLWSVGGESGVGLEGRWGVTLRGHVTQASCLQCGRRVIDRRGE